MSLSAFANLLADEMGHSVPTENIATYYGFKLDNLFLQSFLKVLKINKGGFKCTQIYLICTISYGIYIS